MQCGNETGEFKLCCYKCKFQTNQVCSRCSLKGHNYINCPDHWRLFHLTTKTKNIIIPNLNVNKKEKNDSMHFMIDHVTPAEKQKFTREKK